MTGTATIDYAQRSAELAGAITAAEQAVRAAVHAKLTGDGTADEVAAAKTHLAELREEAVDLDGARSFAADQAIERQAADRQAEFDEFVAHVRTLLAERRDLVAAAIEGVTAALAAVDRYRQIDQTIRAGAAKFYRPSNFDVSADLHDVAALALSLKLHEARFVVQYRHIPGAMALEHSAAEALCQHLEHYSPAEGN